jgi:hypothetical protein
MNNNQRVLIVLVIAIVMASIYFSGIGSKEASTPVIKMDSLSGKLEMSKERYILVTDDTKLQLAMIPPAAMDSLNFHPEVDYALIVKGIRNRETLVVYDAWWKGRHYSFRDSTGQPVWNGIATWKSDPKKCIGCRLCFNNCPVKAITMVNNKAVIDQTKCTGCNTCLVGNLKSFAGCPVKAISK